MEERVHEASGHLKERWKLGLQEVVVVLVLARRKFKVLLHLEQVFLVAETLFLLLAELVQAVVVTVIVDELVVALYARFTNLLANLVQLLAGLNNTRLNEVKFRRKSLWAR